MPQAGPTEACAGAPGFQIWRSIMQMLCITHSGNHHPHISQDLEGYRAKRTSKGQSGPGGSKQGDAPECGNQGAHPDPRVGSLCDDYCSERFQSEPLDTSVCCDIIHPFLKSSCSCRFPLLLLKGYLSKKIRYSSLS